MPRTRRYVSSLALSLRHIVFTYSISPHCVMHEKGLACILSARAPRFSLFAMRLLSALTVLAFALVAMPASAQTPCVGGDAGGYPCDAVDLMSHLPLSTFATTGSSAPSAGKSVFTSHSFHGVRVIMASANRAMMSRSSE